MLSTFNKKSKDGQHLYLVCFLIPVRYGTGWYDPEQHEFQAAHSDETKFIDCDWDQWLDITEREPIKA